MLADSTNYANYIAYAQSEGAEIGLHSYSHSDLSLANGTKIWDVTKAAETITIDRTAGTITLSGGGSVSSFKSKTLAAIKTELEGLGATVTGSAYYTAGQAVVGTIGETALGEVIASGSAVNVINLLVDATGATGYYKSEVADALTLLQAVTGTTIKSFAAPFGGTNANLQQAVRTVSSGQLTSARNVAITGGTISMYLFNLYRYDTGCVLNTTVKTDSGMGSTTLNIKANINSLCSWSAEMGVNMAILAHNTSEMSVTEWGTILDQASLWTGKVQIGAQGTLIADIISNGTDAGSGYTTRAWTDVANYMINSTSPCIGTGSNTPLTGTASVTDYAGAAVTDVDGNVLDYWVGGSQSTSVPIGAYLPTLDALTLNIGSTDCALWAKGGRASTGSNGYCTWTLPTGVTAASYTDSYRRKINLTLSKWIPTNQSFTVVDGATTSMTNIRPMTQGGAIRMTIPWL
jgi:hypothetical protein